jgi:hypothetical protein
MTGIRGRMISLDGNRGDEVYMAHRPQGSMKTETMGGLSLRSYSSAEMQSLFRPGPGWEFEAVSDRFGGTILL